MLVNTGHTQSHNKMLFIKQQIPYISSISLLLLVAFTPVAFATTTTSTYNTNSSLESYGIVDTSSGSYGSYGNSAGNLVTEAGTCGAGQVLGRIIGGTVGRIVGGITSNLKNSITDTLTSGGNEVPTKDNTTRINTGAGAYNTGQLTSAQVGGGQYGAGFSGIIGISTPSWNSIMFCIVNEIMTYITQSTIQWIKTGFNGNPVFIQNMGVMFQQIAKREASAFTREISNGARASAGIVVNGVRDSAYQVAAPFRRGVFNAIAGTQTSNQGLPPLSNQLSQNYLTYTSGNYRAGGMSGLAQLSYNNPILARDYAVQHYQQQVAQSIQIQNSMITDGTRSFTQCRPGAKLRADGSCNPIDLQVTTPSKAINDESGFRQNMKYTRIAFAQNFDSIVTTLVNQLVKIAINKAYEAVQN